MTPKEFTVDWFKNNEGIFRSVLSPLAGHSNLKFLELGSYEGMSACWLLDNILYGEGSNLTCVDTFLGSLEHRNRGVDFNQVKTLFFRNTNSYAEKILVHVGKSVDVLSKFPMVETYDFIYVDGSHVSSDVLTDAVLSHYLLKTDGLIAFDDYFWGGFSDPQFKPKIAIDSFTLCFGHHYTPVHYGPCAVFQKVKPTVNL